MYIRPCFHTVLKKWRKLYGYDFGDHILNSRKAKLGQLIFKQHFIEDSTP